MAKKKKKEGQSVPEWVMTYGDLMSLLLVFFVLIVSFSKIKKEDMQEIKAEIEEIKESFGIRGGGGRLPTQTDPALSFMNIRETVEAQQQDKPNESNSTEPGMEGSESQVTKVREGTQYTIGGRIMFEPGSADLSQQARAQLKRLVEKHEIRGTNIILEVHGHAASLELDGQDSAYPDLWALSHARAQSVFRYLTGEEVKLRPQRFRLVANADREPLAQRAYNAAQQTPNRRASVVWTGTLMQTYTEPEMEGD